MGCLTSWMYAGMFLLLVFAWPLFFSEVVPAPLLIIMLVANGCIAVNAWYQCSSRELSYFAALNIISASLMSGCANITLLYLPFVLLVAYLCSIYFSVLGLLRGRWHAQQSWQGLVLWFVKKRNPNNE